MDQLNGLYQLFIGGAPLSVIDDKLVALVGGGPDNPNPVIWKIQPAELAGRNAVVISTEDEASGWVNAKPGEQKQIEIRPLVTFETFPPTFPTDEVFLAKPLYDGPKGAFTLRSAADDGLVGRNKIEDTLARPKAVYANTDDRDAFVVAVAVET
ncbi:I66 family serine proteinase inhibitor [Streptomyces sp. Y1]|uniref:I66 family serine proteinase inhibitor n=1 Tax=Streptomyces sp. Y1 TaxID=3238634 RepID=A0AB39TU94_9ACTN